MANSNSNNLTSKKKYINRLKNNFSTQLDNFSKHMKPSTFGFFIIWGTFILFFCLCALLIGVGALIGMVTMAISLFWLSYYYKSKIIKNSSSTDFNSIFTFVILANIGITLGCGFGLS